MQTPEEIKRDLPAELDDAERDALAGTGMRLQAARPVPDPNFRGELRRRLLGGAPSRSRVPRPAMRPATVRALSASYACFGGILLAIAAVGVAGVGPFSA